MTIELGLHIGGSPSIGLTAGGQPRLGLESQSVVGAAATDYGQLVNKPSIEGVELEHDRLFPELGIFERDGEGYDVPDKYTLSTPDINALWDTAIPIGG